MKQIQANHPVQFALNAPVTVMVPEFYATVSMTISEDDNKRTQKSVPFDEICDSLKRINKAVKDELQGPLFDYLERIKTE